MCATPIQPRYMKKVHEQIIKHPNYKNKLTQNDRFVIEAEIGGYCRPSATGKKMMRAYWDYLYLDKSNEQFRIGDEWVNGNRDDRVFSKSERTNDGSLA